MVKQIVRNFLILLVLTALPVGSAAAHGGEPGDGNIWSQWAFDPFILIGAALVTLAYLRGRNVLTGRGSQLWTNDWRPWSFLGGMLVIVLALVSPLEHLADELFSAHMVQHTLLMMLAPPLIILGQPFPALLLGLPRRLQRFVGRALGWPGFHVVKRWTLQPLLVWLLHTAVLWVWHAPGLYAAAVENDTIHVLQHISFLGAALLFWWVTLVAFGAQSARKGLAVIYLFVTMLQSGLLGALITFAPTPWYPVYAQRSLAWGLTPISDQQLAGTIMWVPASLVYLVAALGLLKSWIDSIPSSENRPSESEQH